MNPKPLSMELLPMEVSAPPAEPSPSPPPTAGAVVLEALQQADPAAPKIAKPVDRFRVEATHQFEAGHVDEALWKRAFEQAGGDKEHATESYLQTRATALRVLDRELRAKQRQGTVPPSVTMAHIYRGIVPFIMLQLTALAICMYWPEVVFYLPRQWGMLD